MSYKNHKWITALFQYAAIVCVFVSGGYVDEYWVASVGYHPLAQNAAPEYVLVSRNSRSLFHSLLNTDSLIMIVGFALFAAMLCGAIFCILHLTAGDKRYARTVTATSVLQTLLLGAWALLIANNGMADELVKYSYYPGTLFYVLLGVCVLWIAVNLLACRDKKNEK